jgi:hypothetical protein
MNNIVTNTDTSNKIVLFELNTGCGFFSVFFHLCQAYLYAKQQNIPFYITHNKWSHTYKNGWHDYFDTLEYLPQNNPKVSPIICKHGQLPIFNSRYTNQQLIYCIKDIFKLKPFIIDSAEKYIHDVLQNNYIFIYVRRGDKHTETKFVSEFNIIKLINPNPNINIFIQTDDYTVIEIFKRLLPKHNIFYLVDPNKRGHYQSKRFLNSLSDPNPYKSNAKVFNDNDNKQYVFDDTVELLTSCYISSKSIHNWVDYSSNVGRFIKLLSFDKTSPYNTTRVPNLNTPVRPEYSIV